MIAMVFTGGTISMRVDAVAGGAVPALDARDILSSARGIHDVAELRVEDWGRFPGPHMDVERMWALRARLIELVAEDGVDGIVVTHGTDTIEETAYLIARSVHTSKPIVFTGAMRNLSELGWDGPSNLVDAVRVAGTQSIRPHITGGIELHLFEFLFDWKANVAFDVAPGWENITIGVGLWK